MCDYEPMSRGPVSIEPDMQRLTRHQGDREQLLAEYHQVADQAVKAGRKAIRVLAPRLLSLIAEPKMLRAAFDHLAEKGGQAPGHDVRRITDYSSSEAWELCRALSHAILAGTYRPGPERICRIDKGNGRGQRQLILLNVADRIVQRAVTMILQPLFDPGFDPRSFGFRRQRSHLQAVAVAENLLLTQGRRVWVIHDIKTAFEHVSIPRLLNLLHGVLPDDALSEFLRRTLGGKTLKGLPQGGSASPLMLNFYLNHFLDRPWRKAHPNIAMLRFADDLLVLCSDVQQARHVDEELRRLLHPTGMTLKATADEAIHDLTAGAAPTWLGFQFTPAEHGLAMHLTDGSWARLAKHLSLAHTRGDSPLVAERLVYGWLKARGPAFAWSDVPKVLSRVIRIARRFGFEEVACKSDLHQAWQTSHARWCKLRKAVRVQDSDPPTRTVTGSCPR